MYLVETVAGLVVESLDADDYQAEGALSALCDDLEMIQTITSALYEVSTRSLDDCSDRTKVLLEHIRSAANQAD